MNYICIFNVLKVILRKFKRYIVYPPIAYYWTGVLILDRSYLVWNLTNSKIAERKASEPRIS